MHEHVPPPAVEPMHNNQNAPDAVTPCRRLRRFASVGLTVLLALVILRLAWGWEVRRRVAHEVAAARARGEPIRPEDFDPVPVPDDQNAAPVYERAVAAIRLTKDQRQALYDFPTDAPLAPQVRAELESVLKANGEALRLARAARGRPLASWNEQKLRTRVYDTAPEMVGYELGRLLLAAGEVSAAAGDFKAVGETWHDLAHFARALRQCNVLSYSGDESGRVIWWVCAMAERHADGLTVGGARGADPDDLRAVIAELVDDAGWQARQVRTWRTGRMARLDAIPGELNKWPAHWQPVAAALRPVVEMEMLREARRKGATADALARARDVPTLNSLLPPLPPGMADGRSRLDRIARYRSDDSNADSADYLARTYFENVGDRHLTAVALAAWLYRADHGGAWPANVDALVPAYLPSVPTDPYAAGGRGVKLAVSAGGGGWHAVYSVGPNGKDEGGPLPWASGVNAPLGDNKWNNPDAVFYLERTRHPTAATSPATSPAQAEDD